MDLRRTASPFHLKLLSGLDKDLMLEVEVNSLRTVLNIWAGGEWLVSVIIIYLYELEHTV